MQKFCYLGSFLSQNACIDGDITSRISKASAIFGRLPHRLWSDHGIPLSTKIGVYRTVVLTTLLYGSESWTWYRRHVQKRNQFHLKCLRKICGISWKDRITNTTVLERCEIGGIEALLIRGQLRWAGHLTRMEENRIPKALFYGELLVGGQRSRGDQHKRYKDVLKYNLKACDIPIETWERQALNRPEWRTACRVGVERFERRRIKQLQETRIARHAAQNQPVPNTYCLPRLPTPLPFTYRLDQPPQKACHPPQLMLLRERRSVETTAQTTTPLQKTFSWFATDLHFGP